MKGKHMFRVGDVVVIALCAIVAVLPLCLSVGAASGAVVRVTFPKGETVLPLDQDTACVVYGNGGLSLTVQVKDGDVFVTNAACEDKLCERAGHLHQNGQTAACLPAGILLRVESKDAAPDAIAR